MATLDAFTRGYLTAALWTDDPDPRSGEFSEHDAWTIENIAPDSITRAIADCKAFQEANAADLEATGADDDQNGHDFWLTRNGHGVGYWDRGYGAVGDRLSKAARAYGEKYVSGPETEDNGASTPEQLEAWDQIIYIE